MTGPNQELLRVLGAHIRERREEVGLTQIELADEVGLARGSIANLEAGRQNMSISMVARIAQALDSSVAALLGETERPPRLPADINKVIADAVLYASREVISDVQAAVRRAANR